MAETKNTEIRGETGVYIHIPYCARKCPYCDFYSTAALSTAPEYCRAVCDTLADYGRQLNKRKMSTLYFGGGTPGLLEPELITGIIDAAHSAFEFDPDAEITCELNPESTTNQKLSVLKKAGVNRISFGLQSANRRELEFLGRGHNADLVKNAVLSARNNGFENISLDIMIGLPSQTDSDIENTLNFCSSLEVQHISSYILKTEPNTVFGRNHTERILPDDDETAGLYLYTVRRLSELGYKQYEISNFSEKGFESRHNLIYWHGGEYLGVGAAAHSFINRQRFYYPRSINGFISGKKPVADGTGGGRDEYIMLSLRLCTGINEDEMKRRFGTGFSEKQLCLISRLVQSGLAHFDGSTLRLTPEGFLVSNEIITEMTVAE